ncbi:STAS domain-containing protein [Anatilimnocola floriformis]|uniref:STAS domain-containing protein n=1 Tax=Anatilimnocola floriformis TaxID=2948575 RepID=UPI0020C1D392|nr:STAS domain-containing protein [Anatilimnocola floriformis]
MAKSQSKLATILQKYEDDLLKEWIKEMKSGGSAKEARISETEVSSQAKEFISLLQQAAQNGNLTDTNKPEWAALGQFIDSISRSRVLQGFAADETATFVYSFKKPFFSRLRAELGRDADVLGEEVWNATLLLDQLGLMCVRSFQKSREEVINRQQEEMLELSTPVVKLWDGVLALPMIGTLDSARTQIVMESLLQRIVDTGSEIAIIDITGVPTVDTLVAQHLLKTVTAIRLMGADCIISGVRPQIAQTIVHLGVDLAGVTTKASLADALRVALRQSGFVVTKLVAEKRS